MTWNRCPVCSRHVVALAEHTGDAAERSALRKLRIQNPDWDPSSWCCARCLSIAGGKEAWYFRALLNSETAVLPLPIRLDSDVRFTGRGTVIAFIDSGFFPHPDLEDRILHWVDVTDDALGDRYFRRVHPESWHGTMSAVLACGRGTGYEVYSGLAPNAGVVCVKVLNRRTGHVSEKDIARGLRWVIDNRKRFGINIVNVAVGGDRPEQLAKSPVDRLVEEAVKSGLVVVVAGGNSPVNPILPPASAPSAITVGGYDDHNSPDTSLWSAYPSTGGRTLDGFEKPDILGPAAQLPGPLLPGSDQERDSAELFAILHRSRQKSGNRHDKGNLIEKPRKGVPLRSWAGKRVIAAKYITPHHKKMEGTSVAAAVVSSVAAQILEVHPGLGPSEVRSILLDSALPFGRLSASGRIMGMLNPREAIRKALALRHVPDARQKSSPPRFVSIRYEDPSVRQVSLAGDFNNWNPDADPCHQLDDGTWSCFIKQPPIGSERYKLVLDGNRWVADPSSPSREPDGYGGWNSRFAVRVDGEVKVNT